MPPAAATPKAKPKGRRDLAACNLPKVLLEILDEDLEKTAKRIGWDVSHQLLSSRRVLRVGQARRQVRSAGQGRLHRHRRAATRDTVPARPAPLVGCRAHLGAEISGSACRTTGSSNTSKAKAFHSTAA